MARQDLSYCLITTSISLSTGGRLLVQVIVESAKVEFYTYFPEHYQSGVLNYDATCKIIKMTVLRNTAGHQGCETYRPMASHVFYQSTVSCDFTTPTICRIKMQCS